MENYFFELPVYRCTREKYYEDLKLLREKINEKVQFVEGQEKKTEEIKLWLYTRKSYNYDYNETIGWIKLYILGNQIRGEYHYEVNPITREKDRKRFNKGIRKKQFDEFGKAFEISYSSNISSQEIYNKLIYKIKYLMKNEEPFKDRFIDTSKLEKLAEFVDWKNLLEKLNPYNKFI
jgi:hypothetical protein